ncbi:Epsin-2 [Dermatophagoides pteronyssinus]|uniref:Epsin-2 n=1 Tax=Dermatophagoides pteronyssinus TaxID=6956 RepID=A0ABQ8IW96_DERPT|nr:Epsin-2 [Dermatophagoides pteronyssinus]
MANMLNVQEIRRNVINVVKNYSDAQVKVRKATSNEPWGPSATLMAEIADLTYNVVAFSEIMQIIWKRLNDHGKNWRHVYKALLLLEYLIKTGSEKVAQQCRDNLFAIQTLKDFQYVEDNKDQGLSIREKSKLLVNLLKDEEKLKVERSRALKAKERFSQSMSYMGERSGGISGDNAGGEQTFRASTSFPESLSQSEAAARALNSELESARPQTAGEEKLQLELALAMSKEEAEQEERLRKNDDLRLKLALEESEKNRMKSGEAGGEFPHKSAVDELLSLATGPSTSCDPWSSTPTPVATTTNTASLSQSSTLAAASLLPSPPINNKSHRITNHHHNHNDPWSTPPPTTSNSMDFDAIKPSLTTSSAFDDPWAAPSSAAVPSAPIIASNDPWSLNTGDGTNVAQNDPWNLSSSVTNDKKSSFEDVLSEPVKQSMSNVSTNPVRRTPESFLGPNSNLVNLDALVSSNKVQNSTSPNNNPFASVLPPQPVINPFQANKPSQPTINELRAQTQQGGMLIGGSSPILISSSSLSSSPPSMFQQQATPSLYPQLPTLSSSLTTTNSSGINGQQNSVWGNSSSVQSSAFTLSSPNNPFAM